MHPQTHPANCVWVFVMANFAFIDSQNVNLGIRAQGWKLDFQRFRLYLRDKYDIEQAFLFLGYIPSNQRLYDRLTSFGYTLVFKPVLMGDKNMLKGNVDAELVLHTMIEYPNFDQAVLVTGDGDFYCLADYLKKQHKLGGVLIPDKYRHSALYKRLNKQHLYFMNELQDKVEYKKAP